MKPTRLRRSELSTPGSSEKMLQRAATSAADLVFLDLEDSVAPAGKRDARETVVRALTELEWGTKTRAVRINDVNSEFGYEDLIEVVEQAGTAVDLIIVPKVRSPHEVTFIDTLLTAIEAKKGWDKRIGIEALIEEVEGLITVEQIAVSCTRLEALIFGPGDFAASQGISTDSIGAANDADYPGDLWHYARNKIVVAARAAGLAAIDGPYASFRDASGYRREALRSRTLGFVGKWAIHPDQIDIANAIYSPSSEAVEHARQVVDSYQTAMAAGLGAVELDGQMVDAASLRTMRQIIATAELIGIS
jgi:citrate lyase subunit beta/citryl-CoA lyase